MPQESLPQSDDIQASETSEQALLDAVMSNSDFLDNSMDQSDEVPLPEEQELVDDTVEVSEEDPEELTDTDTEEEVEDEEAVPEDEDDSEEDSTQKSDTYTAEDLDLEAKVRVKVDGEELDVSFADLLKGYQVDASLSKKGRELGEAKKQLELDKENSLTEIRNLSEASTAILLGKEQSISKEYHSIEKQIEKAREEGDTYTVSELKDKRETTQKKYWDARKTREELQGNVMKQKEVAEKKIWEENLNHFNETIESHVPGFTQETANSIRDFAISEGLSANIVDTIVDPVIVKVLNDYRKLKTGVEKGKAKRKAVPAKKAVPVKRAKTVNQKKTDTANMKKARAFKDGASQEDQMAFLRDYAVKSLGE